MHKKLIFLLAVAAALIFGYAFYFTTTFKPLEKSQNPKEVVQDFYSKFTACSYNPPKEALGMVTNYCQENTGLTSDDFIQNIKNSPGADSTTCSQNPPEDIVAQSESINGNTAYVDVQEDFGETSENVKVSLVLKNGEWKIDNIICPNTN